MTELHERDCCAQYGDECCCGADTPEPHDIEIETHPQSTDAICSCGWTSEDHVNTYAARRAGRRHRKETR